MTNFDWKNLEFGYQKTNINVRCYFKNGKWGDLESTTSETIPMHISATCLHYGQEAFEGLKAFRGKDGKVRLFRWEENCKRMADTARGILMEPVPEEIFFEACKQAILQNQEFIPPYGTGASLYVRPLLIGTGPQIGVKPAGEYLFVVFVTPVGPYFKGGFKPVKVQIERDSDRAAPRGTGKYKVGGNYAASLAAGRRVQQAGYAAALYLDAREKKYIDECGPANFFGIKDNKYITPLSDSILPSITNKSLMILAKEEGLTVEQRKVPVEELATFEECGECGTAAVITPIALINDPANNTEYTYCTDGIAGPVCTKLYKKLTAIQLGETEDTHNWNTIIC